MIGRNYLKCGSPKRVKMDTLISALLRLMYMSRDMRFQTMWYVRPVKPQISLRVRAV